MKSKRTPDGQRRIVWRYVTGTASSGPDSESPTVAAPARETPEADRAPAEPQLPGWQASSYDLKHGLDVVELPTSLPRDVLDRLFNAQR